MKECLYTEIDGFRIAYHRQGNGQPMVLIHGISMYSFIWQTMLPGLSRHYDVIALDLLGCGDSDKPPGVDYSLSAQAQILKKLMITLDGDPFHLVCHDIGGGIGQILAVQYPEMIKALILINTVGYDYWPVQPIITMRVPVIRHIAMAALDFGMLKALVRRGLYYKNRLTEELLEYFQRPLKATEGRQGFLHLAKCLDNRNLMDIADRLYDIDVPVLIIRGDADSYLGPEISERLHRDIKRSELLKIRTGGFYLQIDEPDKLVDVIHTFIEERANGQK